MKWLSLLAAAAALSGCVTNSAVPAGSHLDRNAGSECRSLCGELEMSLDAVVVIANSTGCVCAPKDRAPGPGASSAAAGGAAIRMAEAAAEQQQQQHK